MSGVNVTFTNLSGQNFENFVDNATSPVVVFFHKNTCGPCKAFHSVFESIAAKWYQKLTFYKFDALQSPEIAEENVGHTYPTVIIFDQGAPFAKHIGATTSEHFNNFMQKQWESLLKKQTLLVHRPVQYPRNIVKG